MTDLVVLVPSRGRPKAAMQLGQAFASFCRADTRLVLAVDADDPTLPDYSDVPRCFPAIDLCIGNNSSMVSALNYAAALQVHEGADLDPAPFAIGFMGDDHRPRTAGWDERYLTELRDLGTGIVYGNDLLQGERIPTQVAMTADIVRALGYMAPPTLTHLAVDNWWLELGHGATCISYLPDVIVEHMHPVAGKAAWDEGYVRVNAQSMYDRDLREFARLRVTDLHGAIAKVRALREVRTDG